MGALHPYMIIMRIVPSVMSRRDQIQMAQSEVQDFLATERTVVCASNGVRGWPHLMPLWYTVRAGDLWCWTYAKSQKARNLERDPRATLQVEAGECYEELRGVMIEANVVIHREHATVSALGRELADRYGRGIEDAVAQAGKRVALEFRTRRLASWDHRKLGIH
jgi:general stress protein 26